MYSARYTSVDLPSVVTTMHVFCERGNLRQSAVDAGCTSDDPEWVKFYARYGSNFTCPTKWGSPNLVYAYQLLLTEARALYPNAKVFYLVSESCIPIVSLRVLQGHRNLYQTRLVPFHHDVAEIAKISNLQPADFVSSTHTATTYEVLTAPTTIPLCFHMQWHSISAEDADLLIQHTDWRAFCDVHARLCRDFRVVVAPDEWFVATALNVMRGKNVVTSEQAPDPTTFVINSDEVNEMGEIPVLWSDFTTKQHVMLPRGICHHKIEVNLQSVITSWAYRLYFTCVFFRKVAPQVNVLRANVLDWTKQATIVDTKAVSFPDTSTPLQ